MSDLSCFGSTEGCLRSAWRVFLLA